MARRYNDINSLKETFGHNLFNIPGWRTKHKIIVIESDDWGSIRMPSVEVFNAFANKGLSIKQTFYNKLDTLESNDDLESLFDILSKHKDSNGKSAVFTANMVVANPDFDKIKATGFEKYDYEIVTKTLNSYPGRENVYSLWMEGNENRIFHPQYHGREHLNVSQWLKQLQSGSENVLFTFNFKTTYSGYQDYNYMEALNIENINELISLKKSIVEGLNIFKDLFGFAPKSFIAPCYTWHPNIENTLIENEIRYLQGGRIQKIPLGGNRYKHRRHFLGDKNKNGLLYLIRNCSFEPSLEGSDNCIKRVLRDIANSFLWNKPAIISSHRINYIGSLDKLNRDSNLRLLDQLLTEILIKWPDVEFMTSDELGDFILKDKNKRETNL